MIDHRFPARAAALFVALALSAGTSMAAYDSPGTASMPWKKAADGTLTNAAGMTLYTFDKDAAGKSACNGGCAKNWPPLMAAADAKSAGEWSIITRDDGSKQWAYEGKPLYTWTGDNKPGDKNGNGFANNAWHTAKD